jgi:hypothetical protein
MPTILDTDSWRGVLFRLPASVKLMLTVFVAIIGFGYLVAAANIFERHQLADGKPGLTLNDIRSVYGGLRVPRSQAGEIPSRMLFMIRDQMRQYVESDSDFAVLEKWLKTGGPEKGLDEGEKGKTPRRVLMRGCLRCHAQSSGTEISKSSPFGPDEFEVDYAKISKFTSPTKDKAGGLVEVPPQYTLPRLILISHQHMLSIPVFTLMIGLLFMFTRVPGRLRAILGPIPSVAMLFDFGGWWLARLWPPAIYFIALAGLAFGLVLGFQILAVAFDLWWPRTVPAAKP